MVLLKIVPIDEGKDTHTNMHVKNIKPNILYRFKINGSPTPPSLSLPLPQAKCLEPRTANWGWTKCYILTGSPPTAPADPGTQGWGRPLGDAHRAGRGTASFPCRERSRADRSLQGSKHLQPKRLEHL